MIIIDEKKIFDVIETKKPVSVALNGPDGILPKVQDLALKINQKCGIPAYLLADATWGSCDLNSVGANVLEAEILFNICLLYTSPSPRDATLSRMQSSA